MNYQKLYKHIIDNNGNCLPSDAPRIQCKKCKHDKWCDETVRKITSGTNVFSQSLSSQWEKAKIEMATKNLKENKIREILK